MIKFKALAVTLVAIVAVFAFASVSKAEVLTFGTTTLKVGSSGMYVTNLQTVLNTYSAAGLTADGAFGPKTNTAVKNFQMAQGLTADGLVGNMTKAKLEAVQGGVVTGGTATCPAGYTCTATGTGSTGSFVINGNAGSIESVDELGSLSGEEVGEGDENVEVIGANIGASEDSDIQLTAVKVSLENLGGGDEDFDEYADSISVMFGDDEVASVDVDDMNEDNGVWSKTITLDSSAIIDADEDTDLTIAVTALDNLDSGDITSDSWSIEIEEVRYKDQTGQVFTDSTTGDLGLPLDTLFDFATFAEANDVEMSLSVADDSPESSTLNVDEDSDTDGVTLLIGEIEADGSDLVFDSIPVYFESSEADLDGVINSVTLEVDGEEYVETVATSGANMTVTFDNLDLTVEDGDTVEFTVTADFNETDALLFAEGTTIAAQIGSTQRADIDVEDQDGEELENSDKTGTTIGETMTAYSSGIMVTFVSASESVTTGTGSNDDIATFQVEFKVEAFDDDMYIPDIASNAGTVAVDFTVDKAGTELTAPQYGSAVTATLVNDSDSDLSGNGNFDINDSDDETLTLTVTVANSGSLGAGQYRLKLANVRWNSSDSASVFQDFTFNLDDFKTDYIAIN